MSGIRLHHSLYKAAVGSTLTYVVEVGAPYHKGFHDCPDCGKRHLRKALHLRLDHQGDVIVSKQVYDALQPRLALAGLTYANDVAKPPPLAIGAVEQSKREVIELPMNLDEAPAPKHRPGKSKSESRAVIDKLIEPITTAKAEKADRIATAKRRAKSRTFVPTSKE